MIIWMLTFVFGKVVGIDRIPKEKRKEFWKRFFKGAGDYGLKLAGEMAEGAAKGIRND